MASDPALQQAIAALSAELATVKGQLAQVQRNQRAASLGNASIDGGSLVINDDLGNGQIILGLQADGTYAHQAITGQVPAAPSAPFVSPLINGLLVGWDGTMGDATLPTADFALVEIHVSTVSGFTPDSTTLQGTMTAPGTYPVSDLVPYTPYFAALVIQNAAGQEGPGSIQSEGVPVGVLDNIPAGSITQGMISFTVQGLTVTLGSAPSSPNTGDLWYDSSNNFQLNQWNGSTWIAYQFGTNAIQAGSITAALIAANTITAAQIASGTITATQIAAATITASLIAAGTIQGTNIAAGTITSNLVSTAAIVAGLIDGNAIDGFTINGAIINGSTISAGDLLISGSQGGLFAYGSGGTIVQTLTSGTSWLCPSGVSSILIEGWAPGGGGGSSSAADGGDGGRGGGGGEYAAEPAMAVTAGNSYSYSLGSPGTGSLGNPGTNGTSLTFAGDTVTLGAHAGQGGGQGSGSGGAGGSGSINSISNPGGQGGGNSGGTEHGMGGGASGTADGTGNGVGFDVRAGASPTGDGGPGGNGGTSTGPDNGFSPAAPGGGGGGGGTDGTNFRKGGNGGRGQIRITYTSSIISLIVAIAGSAGVTDPVGGAAVGAGLTLATQSGAPASVSTGPVLYGFGGHEKYTGTDSGKYNTGRATGVFTSVSQTISSTSATTISSLSGAVAAGIYRIRGVLIFSQGSVAAAQVISLSGPATSSSRIAYFFALESSGVSNGVGHFSIGGNVTSPAFAIGTVFHMWFEGVATFTAAGTLAVTLAEGTSGDTYTLDQNSFIDIMPVT